MNFNLNSLKLEFKEYLEKLELIPKDSEETSSDISIFSYEEEFKDFVSQKFDTDIDDITSTFEELSQMEIQNGKFVTDSKASDEEIDFNGANFFAELFNELFEDEEFSKNLDNNANSTLEDEEIKNFLSFISNIDKENEDISIEDIFDGVEQTSQGKYAKNYQKKEKEQVNSPVQQNSNFSSNGYFNNQPIQNNAQQQNTQTPIDTVSDLEGQVQELDSQITQKQSEITNLESQVQEFGSSIQEKEGSISEINTTITTLQSQLLALEIPDEDSDEYETYLQQKQELENQLFIQQQLLAQEEQELSQLKTQKQEAETKLETSKTELESLNTKRAEINTKLEQEKTRREQLFTQDELISNYVNDGNTMPYYMIQPNDVNPNEPMPLLIFLHGSGEINNPNGLQNVANGNFMNSLPNNFNGYVVCPQLTSGTWSSDMSAEEVYKLVEELSQTYNIDMSNICIAGHSLGGSGSVYMTEHELFNQPNGIHFKRALSISGFTGQKTTSNTPIASYYNPNEDAGNYQSYLNESNGSYYAQMPGVSHGDTDYEVFMMDNNHDGIPDIYEWLFK